MQANNYRNLPVVSFISQTTRVGRPIGHADALISGYKGDIKSKIAALERAGINVVRNPALMGEAMASILAKQKVTFSLFIFLYTDLKRK